MSRLAPAGRGCEQALAVEDLEDAGHAAHVAVEVRHVVGQRVEVERPPRRRHLLNRSDVRRRSQPGWFFAFAAPAGEARGTDQSERFRKQRSRRARNGGGGSGCIAVAVSIYPRSRMRMEVQI